MEQPCDGNRNTVENEGMENQMIGVIVENQVQRSVENIRQQGDKGVQTQATQVQSGLPSNLLNQGRQPQGEADMTGNEHLMAGRLHENSVSRSLGIRDGLFSRPSFGNDMTGARQA